MGPGKVGGAATPHDPLVAHHGNTAVAVMCWWKDTGGTLPRRLLGYGAGRLLIMAGIVLVWPAWSHAGPLGRLPGDIRIQGKYSSFYFPW